MLMRVVKKLSELTDDPDMVQFIDVEKGMELGHKEDIEEAVQKAEKQKQIETAKKMLMKNMKLEDIIDITGLSKEEIQKIEEN